ncbi:MAG: lipoyl(octanoyl) transferase LipB [Clostridia bacterium]|nr:lipoyl(octanoyl) transferase LipB [Clostridia bacterium]
MDLILVAIIPGLTGYLEGLQLQRRLMSLRQQEKIRDILLLLEHPPVLTLGKNADETHFLFSPADLADQGCKVYRTERGGDVTYHGPGQIVGYSIMHLKENGIKLRKYIWLLEQVFIDLLAEEYALQAYRDPNYRGVWLQNRKITAIGCAVKQWVTLHGFAFNVNTNLEHFQFIHPCGITDKGITSLQAIFGSPLDLSSVQKLVIKYFCRSFAKEPQIISGQELQKLLASDFSAFA